METKRAKLTYFIIMSLDGLILIDYPSNDNYVPFKTSFYRVPCIVYV